MSETLDKAASAIIGTNKICSALSPLQQSLRQARKAEASASPEMMPERLALLLDCSGSMGETEQKKPKIEHLREAVVGFLNACDWAKTSLSVETFPSRGERSGEGQPIVRKLNSSLPLHTMTVMSLASGGNTPLAASLERVLCGLSITRAVVVSDGAADDFIAAKDWASKYKEAGVPVDTVHIGSGEAGQALLQEIAELTGGIFIKFKDVASFARSFKYLTPGSRALLTDGSAASLLGAEEVKLG